MHYEDVPGGDAFTYGRYWHGYLVILKPLLFIFNYYQIRWLNTIIGCSLISIIMIGFYKNLEAVNMHWPLLQVCCFLICCNERIFAV